MDTNKPEEAQTPLTKETTPKPGESKDDDEEEAYPPELLNNLIFRYEEPSTHSRWDKPLFTVPGPTRSPQSRTSSKRSQVSSSPPTKHPPKAQ